MKPQQGRTARCILWALGFPLALWLAAALADAFSGGASLSRVLARFSVCMNAPFSVRWTEDTGRFLLLAGLLYPAGAVAVESGRGNRRPGEEYGSARWGDPRAIGKKYRDRRHREKKHPADTACRAGPGWAHHKTQYPPAHRRRLRSGQDTVFLPAQCDERLLLIYYHRLQGRNFARRGRAA